MAMTIAVPSAGRAAATATVPVTAGVVVASSLDGTELDRLFALRATNIMPVRAPVVLSAIEHW
jgi:hypothetical protein